MPHRARKRVARLMRARGLGGTAPAAVSRDDRQSRMRCPSPPNVSRGGLRAPRPIACGRPISPPCPTREGWCYLAVILDLCSRRVVGWALQRPLGRDLVLAALHWRWRRRRPPPGCCIIPIAVVSMRAAPIRRCWRPRHRVQYEPRRQLLGQSPVESFFSHAQNRTAPGATVGGPRAPPRTPRFATTSIVLQPTAAALGARLS